MSNPAPRQGNSANRVVRFMMDQQAQLEHARVYLANPANHVKDRCPTIVLTGLLVALAGQAEAIGVACDIEPLLKPIKTAFDGDFEQWISFRHDAAHAAERIFRELPAKRNVNDPQTSNATVVCNYEWKTETVRTGDGSTMYLPDAIRRSQEVIYAARNIVGL